jgi:hypothetical protein
MATLPAFAAPRAALSGDRVTPAARFLQIAGFTVAIIACMSVQTLEPPAPRILIAVLSVWALLGPLKAVQALTLGWLTSMLNLEFFDFFSVVDAIGKKWFVLFAAAAGTYWRTARRMQPLPAVLLAIVAFVTINGIAALGTSYEPLISVLKLTALLLGSTVVVLIYYELRHDLRDATAWFIALAVAVILSSALLYVLTGLGYQAIFRSAPLFKGVLMRPNDVGVCLAPLAAWLTTGLLFDRVPSKAIAGLTVAAWLMLFVSGSRTGFIAASGAIMLIVGVAAVRPHWRAAALGTAARSWTLVVMLLCLLVVIVKFDPLSQKLTKFAYKRATSLSQEYAVSRGILVGPSLENFAKYPVFGIGFGMASNPEEMPFRHWRNSMFGIPTSAPVEKGVLVIAMLEECGIVGLLAFLALLGALYVPIVMHGSPPLVAMALAIMLLNFGEANFLAFGGSGLYHWLLVGLAYAEALARREARFRTHAGFAR